MTKKPTTGGEIDSYCTKCKLDLGHRIIAMVGDTVKKVECSTCKTHHLYRRPKSELAAAKKSPAKRTTRKTAAERLTAAQRAEREMVATWEQAIAGKPATAFSAYRTTSTLGQGELIRHTKFGDGYVSRVIDRGKVEILFQDGARTMAHGQA